MSNNFLTSQIISQEEDQLDKEMSEVNKARIDFKKGE